MIPYFIEKYVYFILTVILLSTLVTSCNNAEINYADTIYINGHIITIDDENPFAEALAAKEGLILEVGDVEDVLRLKGPLTNVVELEGNSVLPGFIDSHSHFAGVGTQAIVANLLPAPDGPVNSISDLQAEIHNFIQTSPIVENYNVAIGFNYDDSQLKEKRHPNRHDLDAVSKELPIVVMHQSGHIGAYNSKALELMGITADTIDPPGGVIERESDGKTPSGVMQENAHFMIFFKFIPDFTMPDLVKLYKAGEHAYVSNGFTTVQEGKTDLATLKMLPEIAKSTDFKVDIISYPDIAAIGDSPLLRGKAMSPNYINGFRIGGVKITLDGSPQGKTAWLTEPYLQVPEGQKPDYSGYPAFSDQEALKWMSVAFKNRWQLLVHANGDAAIDQLIRLVKKSDNNLRNIDHRTVLIHGQYTRADQVKDMLELNIFPSLYPMHTFYWGDWHRDSVAGIGRAKNISPTGWFVEENLKFSIHSDAPVTFPNSMRIVDSAVNRVTRTKSVLGEEHRISPMNALRALTIWGAYQNFEESIKGSLVKGKQADLVILDKDPLTIDPLFLQNIKVLKTINNDEVTFSYTDQN